MYFIEKIKGVNYLKQFDYILFISVLILSIIGLVVLNSATLSMPGGGSIMKTQIVSVIIGVIASLVISAFDYNNFKSIAFILYLVSIGLLMLVLFIGVGYKEVGSNSWIIIPVIGGFSISFQPAELSKITLVILLSAFLERIKEGQEVNKNIIKLIIYFLLMIGLIIKQPDYGMAIVFFIAFFIMIYICGVKYKHIFIAVGTLLFTTPFLWFFTLNEQRKKRILEFISPGFDPGGASYQLDRAQIAIGSGRIYGSGLYKGIQTQTPPHIGGVPVRESDMIFSVIGEELGFIGSVLIITLILFIILRCIHVARNSRDYYGSFLVVGLTGMLAYQSLQNIGMCLRLLPLTGLPLPFISAGGSAMVTNYISIGIVLSVSMRRKRAMFSNQQ
ncbi:MAG: FtsW/RodA/SpoVE family cell cycle protein [Firmicutes bacterium]|nr:FtsW/RodA/SpoVE family cell cycle protein [Bacillota bacterium]